MKENQTVNGFAKVLHIVRDVLLWLFVAFCLLSALVFMPSVGAVLLLLIGVASMPLRMVRKVWNYIPQKLRFIKPLALTILFFVAAFNVPITETPKEDANGIVVEQDVENLGQEIESETVSEQSALPDDDSPDDDLPDAVVVEGEAVDVEIEQGKTTQEDENIVLSPEETARMIEKVIADGGFPAYTGSLYVTINDNVPYFTAEEMSALSYEYYSPLDDKGRCGVCVASIGVDIMPTEERGEIGSVKPSGWNQVKYAGVVDGNYLYNRSHLIGFQLTGENANTSNLITGTRYFNTEGMLPFENMVADYVKETGNHVMYRVSPVFEGDNLLASGVLMEAKSVEDDGEGILFCVYCFNVQPGVVIDYSDGSSVLQEDAVAEKEAETSTEEEQKSTQTPEEPTAEDEQKSTQTPEEQSNHYAVNSKNGKIHMVGECFATGEGDNAMTDPVYFTTYEEALAYSQTIAPKLEKRDCGNCW